MKDLQRDQIGFERQDEVLDKTYYWDSQDEQRKDRVLINQVEDMTIYLIKSSERQTNRKSKVSRW